MDCVRGYARRHATQKLKLRSFECGNESESTTCDASDISNVPGSVEIDCYYGSGKHKTTVVLNYAAYQYQPKIKLKKLTTQDYLCADKYTGKGLQYEYPQWLKKITIMCCVLPLLSILMNLNSVYSKACVNEMQAKHGLNDFFAIGPVVGFSSLNATSHIPTPTKLNSRESESRKARSEHVSHMKTHFDTHRSVDVLCGYIATVLAISIAHNAHH